MEIKVKKSTIKNLPSDLKDFKESAFNENVLPSESESNSNNEKKLRSKIHLPILYLNKEEEWKPAPLSERRHLTDKVAHEVCGSNCCGYKDLAAACCQISPENLEHILGAITKEDISRLLKQLKKSIPTIEKSDIVIEREEGMLIGKTFFEGHDIFNQKTSYPMLRFQIYENRFICKFLNPKTKQCTVYSARPDMCRDYFCRYIKSNFLVRTPSNPNIYKKVD